MAQKENGQAQASKAIEGHSLGTTQEVKSLPAIH
jgi:hypothetical protein